VAQILVSQLKVTPLRKRRKRRRVAFKAEPPLESLMDHLSMRRCCRPLSDVKSSKKQKKGGKRRQRRVGTWLIFCKIHQLFEYARC